MVIEEKFNKPYVASFAKVSYHVARANHVVVDNVVVPRAPAFLALVLRHQDD